MLILAIDTSGPDCAAGIYDSSRSLLVVSRSETIGKGHAERLPGMVEAVVSESGLILNALDRIAVVVGPGSFTGIRVGVAFARGLALALDVPVVGVTTLNVVALPGFNNGRPVLALIDARRGELYAQLFAPDGQALDGPAALDPGAAEALSKAHGAVSFGSGARVLAGEPSPQLDTLPLSSIGEIGAHLPAAVGARPLYIRGADAKPQEGFAVARA